MLDAPNLDIVPRCSSAISTFQAHRIFVAGLIAALIENGAGFDQGCDEVHHGGVRSSRAGIGDDAFELELELVGFQLVCRAARRARCSRTSSSD